MIRTIFITHLPAFYKVNLYNEIAKSKDISVWFLGNSTTEQRAKDFVPSEMNFDHWFVNSLSFQDRSKFLSSLRLIRKLSNQRSKEIIISGWDLIEFWLVILFFKKKKMSLVLESSAFESSSAGFKGFIKKFFLKRISKVYASGDNHIKLLKSLNFKGQILKTRGVGLINYNLKSKPLENYQKQFLYVGRLSKVKNLNFLINVFNKLPHLSLTLIGIGPIEDELKSLSGRNIKFVGSVNNKDLTKYFSKYNFLILPSYGETWGLVVEEAFYNGLPVIISDKCGSVDLVKNNVNGYIFDPANEQELHNILIDITDKNYQFLKNNISKDFIVKKDKQQVNSYLS